MSVNQAVLQQEFTGEPGAHGLFERQAPALRGLAYRSLAVSDLTDSDLRDLLHAAQRRNKAEGLSGVLLFDQGAFFQWLEGPSDALARVWDSISRDPRHHQVTVLRDEPIAQRVFEDWDLRIAMGPKVSIDAAIAAINSSSTQLLKHLVAKPTSLINMTLEDVFARSVLPRLLEVHARSLRETERRQSTAKIWHADLDSGAKLAHVLLAPRSGGTARYIDSLLEQGASVNALYHEVFEPAQLHLGKLWDTHDCDDFHLSVGLARLHLEVRRVNAALPGAHAYKPGQRVLLCPQPTESHSLGLVMSSEIFDRHGWQVTCEFPSDDQTLLDVVHGHWFDVMKLSQSGSLLRDSRLLSMRDTIDAARRASLNPALIVIVDGRTFVERPQVYRAVHANAVSLSVLQAVPLAQRLLDASRSVMANVQVSAA
jgi:hypothetical protein